MRKLLIFLFLFLISFNPVYADYNEKIRVTLSACVDGDTAKVILDNKEITVRFLAIDTPETVHPKVKEEPYGKEASDYTCAALKKAQNISIEYDNNSDKLDKYNRHLVWIWVDDYLLQNKIIKEGLGEVAYLYGNYKYTPTLQDSEVLAKVNKIGMWSDKKTATNTYSIILTIITLLLLVFFSSKLTSKQKRIINIIKKHI
jgi:micrococcal nuclease